MESFKKKAAAIIDLQQRGYDQDFVLNNGNLLCVQHGDLIAAGDFEITEVHQFQERVGLNADCVICAVTSVNQGLKGILMISCSASVKYLSTQLCALSVPGVN